MRPTSTLSMESSSDSSMSSAFSFSSSSASSALSGPNQHGSLHYNHDSNTSTTLGSDESRFSHNKQLFTKFVKETCSKMEQKTSEINATMQEKLPEWKQRGVMYSNKAKETSIGWGRRGKEAVDKWKKERAEQQQQQRHSMGSAQTSENAVFGMPLEIAVALTRIDSDDLVPAVFRRCIEYLNDVGIHEVGIYRIPGSTTTVNRLRAIFDEGDDVDFDNTKPDPHAVGTLLKMYLRELPEPIISPELIDEHRDQLSVMDQEQCGEDNTPTISTNIITTVRSITSKLPVYNHRLLQLLCKHLKAVASNEPENRMSISNLALIFIPTLNLIRVIFHCMIEHYDDIFSKIPPPLPQKPSKNLAQFRKNSDTSPLTSSSTSSTSTNNSKPIIPPKPIVNTKAVPSSSPVSPPPKPVPSTSTPSSLRKKIVHSKQMSDTTAMLKKIPPPKPSRTASNSSNNSNDDSSSVTNTCPKVPPRPPPQRPRNHSMCKTVTSPPAPASPLSSTTTESAITPSITTKPRSKSVSTIRTAAIRSPPLPPQPSKPLLYSLRKENNGNSQEDLIWKQNKNSSGRVGVIGRQFELLMSSSNGSHDTTVPYSSRK